MSTRKVVVIGGVAAGPKTASKVARLDPQAEVTVIEKGEFLSYAGCGLPYYISGVVKDQKELMSTQVGVVRDAAFFQKVKNVRVLNRTMATEVDRVGKRVRIHNHDSDEQDWLSYDKLMPAYNAVEPGTARRVKWRSQTDITPSAGPETRPTHRGSRRHGNARQTD